MSYYQQVQLSDALKAVDAANARAERLAAVLAGAEMANAKETERAERLEAALREWVTAKAERDAIPNTFGFMKQRNAAIARLTLAEDDALTLLDSLAPQAHNPRKD